MRHLAAIFVLALASASALSQAPAKPEAELKAISYLVGNFDAENTITMGPETAKDNGTCVSKWALKDRYIRMEVAGTMGSYGPYEGLMLLTYNEMSKKYEAAWFDSMGGQSLRAVGQIEGGKLTLVSDAFAAGGPEMRFRMTYSQRDAKTVDFRLDAKVGDADWSPQLVSVYRRK